jgi:predicted transglutaminase-like cysteine proteinase
LVVAVLACLTISSALTAAHANVITVAHLVQGEQMLADGGWTSACDTRVEHCSPVDGTDHDGLNALHHHHHSDYQFGTMAAVLPASDGLDVDGRTTLPAYTAVVKSASPSMADQPPKI